LSLSFPRQRMNATLVPGSEPFNSSLFTNRCEFVCVCLSLSLCVCVWVYVFLSIHADSQPTQGRLCWVSVDPLFTFAKHCNYLPSALYREGTQITWIFVSRVCINESRVPGISLEKSQFWITLSLPTCQLVFSLCNTDQCWCRKMRIELHFLLKIYRSLLYIVALCLSVSLACDLAQNLQICTFFLLIP